VEDAVNRGRRTLIATAAIVLVALIGGAAARQGPPAAAKASETVQLLGRPAPEHLLEGTARE
jgi:hypothetical protein